MEILQKHSLQDIVLNLLKWNKGTYRSIGGNTALSYGLITASQKSGLPIFLGTYPITPASDILHELAKHKKLWY